MRPAKPQIARKLAAGVMAAAAALLLSACGAKPRPAAHAGAAPAPDVSYLEPPSVDAVSMGANGPVLSGAAPAGGKVRLATPAGGAMFTTAGPQGRWSLGLPPATEARIFGLSVTTGQRQAQAEGYVLVTPTGQAALLRAGAGAVRIDPQARSGIRAIDFDRGGALEVSMAVPPGATVIMRLDGRQVAEGRADAKGRYEVSLGSPTPIRPGAHQLQVFGDGFSDQATVQLSPASPLAEGPLRSQLTPAGLRVDWMTPGGGEQSTLLVH